MRRFRIACGLHNVCGLILTYVITLSPVPIRDHHPPATLDGVHPPGAGTMRRVIKIMKSSPDILRCPAMCTGSGTDTPVQQPEIHSPGLNQRRSIAVDEGRNGWVSIEILSKCSNSRPFAGSNLRCYRCFLEKSQHCPLFLIGQSGCVVLQWGLSDTARLTREGAEFVRTRLMRICRWEELRI